MSGPLAIVNYDEHGYAASMSFPILPCSGEPRDTFERIVKARQEGRYEPWTHGVATMVVPNGCDTPMAFCTPCGERWRAETARLARLRRLPPSMRAWLTERGLADWTREMQAPPLGPAPDIRRGDVVRWHEEINAEWTVLAVHKNGRVTIALDTDAGTVSRTALVRDCRLVARPAGDLFAQPAPGRGAAVDGHLDRDPRQAPCATGGAG